MVLPAAGPEEVSGPSLPTGSPIPLADAATAEIGPAILGAPPPGKDPTSIVDASLPTVLSPEAIRRGFEAVVAEAAKPKYPTPRTQTIIEQLAEDYAEDVILEISGHPPHRPYMTVKIPDNGLTAKIFGKKTYTEYTVEQSGDTIRVFGGPEGHKQEVILQVLEEAQRLNQHVPPIFNPDDLQSFISSARKGKIAPFTEAQRLQAFQIAKLSLFQGSFVNGVGSVEGANRARKAVNATFERMKTEIAAGKIFRFQGLPGIPREPLPEPVRLALRKIVHKTYIKAAPPRTRPIDLAEIRQAASTGAINLRTETCFAADHVLEGERRVFGCVTPEGAFLSKKFGFLEDDPNNPFLDAEWSTSPSLQDLNKKYESLGRTIPDWESGEDIAAMEKVLEETFVPDTPEGQALLETGRATIINEKRRTERDLFWGTNPRVPPPPPPAPPPTTSPLVGTNMLGQLLMERRGLLGGVPYHADQGLSRDWAAFSLP
jgi:hypothetical protein